MLLALTLAPTPQAPAPAPSSSVQDVDETYDLDIAERVIEQQDYVVEQALQVSSEGWGVAVGARLTAGHIRVLLRNVRGHVRFRATFRALDSVLGRARATPPHTTPQGGRR
jgi:hypothetical protein